MSLNRVLALCLGACLTTLSAMAQVEPEARKALETLGTPKTLKADFIQEKSLVDLGRPIVAKGRLVYSAQEGVIWNLREPIQHVLVLPTRGASAGNRALAESAAIVGSIVAGNPDALARHFAISATPDDAGWDVRLKPGSQALSKVFSEITLRIESKAVTKVVMREIRGDSVTIKVLNPMVDQPLSPEELAAFKAQPQPAGR